MSLEEAFDARIKGEYKKALMLYWAVLNKMPDNAKAHEGVAVCSVNLKDYATAINSANRALALDPMLVSPHLVLADIYRHQRKPVEADEEVNKAVDLDPNSAYVIFTQGVNLSWKKEYNEAAGFFVKAIDADPNSSIIYAAHFNLGSLYRYRKEFKQAVQEYQQAYELRPSKRLLFAIWTIKYRLAISIVFAILWSVIPVLSFVLANGLLLALYLLPILLISLGVMVIYIKQKKIAWAFVSASASIVFGWFIYGILCVYFTR